MKRLCALILLLLGCDLIYAQTPTSLAEAIARYEQAIAQGVRDARILAHLGQLYAQAEDWPRAALRLAQAQALAPRDPLISASLLEAQERSGAQFAPQTDPWLGVIEAMQSLLSRDESLWIAVGLWWAWWLMACAARLRPAWQSWLYPTLAAMALLLGLYAALLGLRLWVESQRPAVMLMQVSTGYSGPGEDFLTLTELPPATLARQVEIRDGWARVQWPDGGQAWVRRDSLALLNLP